MLPVSLCTILRRRPNFGAECNLAVFVGLTFPVADHLSVICHLSSRRQLPDGSSPRCLSGHGCTWRGAVLRTVTESYVHAALCPLVGAGRATLAIE
eukprot:9844114-Alexandrium_andersonii.AAC.1